MDKERQKMLAVLQRYAELEKLLVKKRELEAELKRCFHFMIFWPEGYNTINEVTGKKENPKLTFGSAPGHGSKTFSMTMTRADLDQSHTFVFKARLPRQKQIPEHMVPEAVPEGWVVKQRFSHQDDVYIEPHDCTLEMRWSKRVLELVESDVEGLDVTEMPKEAIVAVTKHYVEHCLY